VRSVGFTVQEVSVELEVGPEFLERIRRKVEGAGLPSEVVIVAPRPGGKVLLHTKSFYPPGTYRLPTGKMQAGERPEEAFHREFREELGIEGRIDRLLGVIHCRLASGSDAIGFTSYVHLACESSEEPRPADGAEQITGFIEVPASDLRSAADRLRNLPSNWRDWGRFRAIAHDFAADELA